MAPHPSQLAELLALAAATAPNGYACRLVSPYWIGIPTPYLYPDRDLVEVFASPAQQGGVLLSDLSEAIRHATGACAVELHDEHLAMIGRIAAEHDVRFQAGVLSTTTEAEHLFPRVQALARVISRVTARLCRHLAR